jgi:hypothetical protein
MAALRLGAADESWHRSIFLDCKIDAVAVAVQIL